eukprot:scaffold269_cov125-Cylindrotheca_fusiformis.AAC.2
MNPHVVIQVRMTTFDSERAAMFDMMTFGGQDEYHALGRPRMGYLIDVLWTESPLGSPVYGFDVYEVAPLDPPPEDQPLVLPNLGRPIKKYRVGGNEDGAITIAADHLDLENLQAFSIPFATIREELEDCDVEFVAQQ